MLNGETKASAEAKMIDTDGVDELPGGTKCASCGHRYCKVCQECSVSQRYSDYWICHSCASLSRWIPGVI